MDVKADAQTHNYTHTHERIRGHDTGAFTLRGVRNQEWLHTLDGGRHGWPVEHRDSDGSLADGVLSARSADTRALRQELRVTLDGFHCGMRDVQNDRQKERQKIKTQNRQERHQQDCSDGECSLD